MERADSVTGTVTRSGGIDFEIRPDFELPPRWKLARALGRGGQASVWLAHDEQLDDWVAIKVLDGPFDPIRMERLRREVNLGRSLAHPNLLRVYELMDLGEHLGVVMEWVEGGSLSERLEEGPLPVVDVIEVARQMLDVLAHMHGQGVVHRDIKPSNLLVDNDGSIRLADLGLARPVEDSRALTRTQTVPGTPRYMSPEQIRGHKPSPSADLYSLGVTLYQLLTGSPPFSGSSDFDVADQHLRAQVVNPRKYQPNCPRWFSRFIRRLLEKEPADRWPDAVTAMSVFEKRRSPISPRLVRRGVGVVFLGLLGMGASWGILTVRDQTPAAIGYDDQGILARNTSGRVLWSRSFELPPSNWTIGDFLGEGRSQVALGFSRQYYQSDGTQPEILVLDADGEPYRKISLGSAFEEDFPGFDKRWIRATVDSQDIDGDGRPNLIWWARHRSFFPAILGAWNLDGSGGRQVIFSNSGHLQDVRAADLDDDGIPEIVFTGINNRLGFQSFVVVLRSENGAFLKGRSPDTYLDGVTRFNQASFDYTLLGPFSGDLDIVGVGPGGISIGLAQRLASVDRDGNPIGSLLDGAGRSARTAFWSDLGGTCFDLAVGRLAPDDALTVLDRHSDVLSEEPMEVAALLLLTRGMAMAGHLDRAVAELDKAVPEHPVFRDLQLRLGEYLLMAGQRAKGQSLLEDLLHDVNGRGSGDSRQYLVLDAAVAKDDRQFSKTVDTLLALGTGAGQARALTEARTQWAFFRGAWEDEALDPGQLDWAHRELAVYRLWAGLYRGQDPAVIADQARELATNPEISALAGLLQAECLVRLARPQRALPMAEKQLRMLEPEAQWQYEKFVSVPLAHHVIAVAAEAVGDAERARSHRAKARQLAPKCWFAEGEAR